MTWNESDNMEIRKINMKTPFLLYKNASNQVKVDVLLKDETIWLKQNK
jgi:hypothetical protein